jgi:glycosyl transferase family 25
MTDESLGEPLPVAASRVDATKTGSQSAIVEIVVISLPNAIERRRKIDAMFEGTKLNWRYFNAHTSLKHSGLRYDAKTIKRRFGRILSAPEIAVCSSHFAVLSEFLERGSSDYVLVLEDDVIFDVDFPLSSFGSFCSQKGIHYIRLFGKHYAAAIRLGFYLDRSIVRYKTSPAGAQAYLMSVKGARLFTDNYKSIDEAFDLAIDKFWNLPLPIYSIFPYPVIERYSPTSIPVSPYTNELGTIEKLVWNLNRGSTKAQKIWANLVLRSSDRRMKRQSAHFQQILDTEKMTGA